MGDSKKKIVILKYPRHAYLKPSELLHFVYLDGFEDEWKELGLGEEDLGALEVCIMTGGKDAPVIKGTGGLRKLRFAPEKWKSGKSGAARVCFVFFPEFFLILLVTVYRKSEYDDLSASGKSAIHKMISQVADDLAKRKVWQ